MAFKCYKSFTVKLRAIFVVINDVVLFLHLKFEFSLNRRSGKGTESKMVSVGTVCTAILYVNSFVISVSLCQNKMILFWLEGNDESLVHIMRSNIPEHNNSELVDAEINRINSLFIKLTDWNNWRQQLLCHNMWVQNLKRMKKI